MESVFLCVDFGWRIFLFCVASMQYTKEQLDQINIHALRNIAREVGVRSPTSLNKQPLIDEIMQIASGNKQPHRSTRGGRHVKNFVIEDINNQKDSELVRIKKGINAKVKKEFIDFVLKEVEKKLNELLS